MAVEYHISMFIAILSMGVLCAMVVGAWIAINPPTKWVNDKTAPKDRKKP